MVVVMVHSRINKAMEGSFTSFSSTERLTNACGGHTEFLSKMVLLLHTKSNWQNRLRYNKSAPQTVLSKITNSNQRFLGIKWQVIILRTRRVGCDNVKEEVVQLMGTMFNRVCSVTQLGRLVSYIVLIRQTSCPMKDPQRLIRKYSDDVFNWFVSRRSCARW